MTGEGCMTAAANEKCQTIAPKNGTLIALPQTLCRVQIKDTLSERNGIT